MNIIRIPTALFLATCVLASAKPEKSSPKSLHETDRAEGAMPCDWLEFRATSTSNAIEIFYRCTEPIDFARGAAYCVYFDVDENRNTGYRGANDQFPLGADIMLQASTVYRYAGQGNDWSWTDASEVSHVLNQDTAEFQIPLELFTGARKSVRLFLLCDNTAQGVEGNFLDTMPDNAIREKGQGQSYRLHLYK